MFVRLGLVLALDWAASAHCVSVDFHATAGQEDPFELDSNLLLSSGRHGVDRKRQFLTERT
jgi:hypothetical protein